ncbi:MAG: esterase family protein [Nonlabens sp.]|nr:esterase family protein [Nonlabens sp.]MDP5102141.1 esterase family protein [Nonlabens sp.]
MRILVTGVVLLLYSVNVFAQALYRSYPSDVLGEERNIKILKPRNYAENPEKTYPLIIVLDGDFLFEPVAGNVDYLSYWDQMPESFVVGINQSKSRYDDCAINRETGFPEKQSLAFMDFVMEVRQTMLDEYRVVPFTVLIGKDITANLSSFYLMRNQVPIQAMIHIEPQYSDIISNNLTSKINSLKEHNYLYVASSSKEQDLDDMYASNADSLLTPQSSKHLSYEFIEGTNKYDVAAQAIPRGLQFIFKEYSLINPDSFLKETLATTDGTPAKGKDAVTALSKLKEKYAFIKQVYGVDMKVRLVDLVSISEYLIKNKQWEPLLDMSEFTYKTYPDILYGRFLEGMAYEGLDRPDRALKSYNAAYVLSPAVGINKDNVLDKIEYLQNKQ